MYSWFVCSFVMWPCRAWSLLILFEVLGYGYVHMYTIWKLRLFGINTLKKMNLLKSTAPLRCDSWLSNSTVFVPLSYALIVVKLIAWLLLNLLTNFFYIVYISGCSAYVHVYSCTCGMLLFKMQCFFCGLDIFCLLVNVYVNWTLNYMVFFSETIVGVNKYRPDQVQKVDVLSIDNTMVREKQIARIKQTREARDAKKV